MSLEIQIPRNMTTTDSAQVFETFSIRAIPLSWTPRVTGSSVSSKHSRGSRKQRNAILQNVRQIEKKLALIKLNVSSRANSKSSMIRAQQTVKRINLEVSYQSELLRYEDKQSSEQLNHIKNNKSISEQPNHIHNDKPSTELDNHINNVNIVTVSAPYHAQVDTVLDNDEPVSEEYNPIHYDNLQVAEQSDAHVSSILPKDNPDSEQFYHNQNDQVNVSKPSDHQVGDELRSEQCNHIQNDRNDESGAEQRDPDQTDNATKGPESDTEQINPDQSDKATKGSESDTEQINPDQSDSATKGSESGAEEINPEQRDNAIKDSGPSDPLVTDVCKDNRCSGSDQPNSNRHNQLARASSSSYSLNYNKDKASSKQLVIRNEYLMSGSGPSSEAVGEDDEDKPKLKFHEMRRKNGKIKKEFKAELKKRHQEEYLAKIKPKSEVTEQRNSNSNKQPESRKVKQDKFKKLVLRNR